MSTSNRSFDDLITLHRPISDDNYTAVRNHQTAIADAYRMLSPDVGQSLAEEALPLLDGERRSQGETVLRYLAAYVPNSLKTVHATLAERDLLTAPYLFYCAGEEARDTLARKLQRMEADMSDVSPEEIKALLSALAWIGDKAVQAQFFQWWLMPPKWRSMLPMPPHEYGRVAGWHLTKEGRRRDLFYPDSYELQRLPDNATPPASNPVGVAIEQGETSPAGGPLLTLLDLDLSSGHPIFAGLPGERLRIATCPQSVQDGPVYTEVDINGRLRWSSVNHTQGITAEAETIRYPVDRMVLSNPRRTTLETQPDRYEPSLAGASGLGGYPTWLNGPVYLSEPFAGRPMMFVGQVAVADLLADPNAPGMYYAFLNEDATVAATFYQEH